MASLLEITPPAPRVSSHARITSTHEMTAILAPGVWFAHLPRQLSAELLAYARSLAALEKLEREIHVTPETSLETFGAGLPEAPESSARSARDALVDDVTSLVSSFARVSGAPRLRVNLSAVTDDSCRKFHVDRVGLRLVCTYAGPGTEWIASEDVRFEAFEEHHHDIAAANAAVLRRGGSLRRVATGDVLVMKGTAWRQESGGRGAVHRSPPIEASGERRLVLVISTV